MAEELGQFYRSLEKKVEDRTAELSEANDRLNLMNTQLEKASKAKASFWLICHMS